MSFSPSAPFSSQDRPVDRFATYHAYSEEDFVHSTPGHPSYSPAPTRTNGAFFEYGIVDARYSGWPGSMGGWSEQSATANFPPLDPGSTSPSTSFLHSPGSPYPQTPPIPHHVQRTFASPSHMQYFDQPPNPYSHNPLAASQLPPIPLPSNYSGPSHISSYSNSPPNIKTELGLVSPRFQHGGPSSLLPPIHPSYLEPAPAPPSSFDSPSSSRASISNEGSSTNGKEKSKSTNAVEAARAKLQARNRLAAIRSRQKKRDHQETLENHARVQAGRNAALQSMAHQLLAEAQELRAHLAFHNGCSCGHVFDYMKRERNSGGLKEIANASQRILSLNFEKVPSLGSRNDVYSHELGNGDDEEYLEEQKKEMDAWEEASARSTSRPQTKGRPKR